MRRPALNFCDDELCAVTKILSHELLQLTEPRAISDKDEPCAVKAELGEGRELGVEADCCSAQISVVRICHG